MGKNPRRKMESIREQLSCPVQGNPACHHLALRPRGNLVSLLPSTSHPRVPWELVAISSGVLREMRSLIDFPGGQIVPSPQGRSGSWGTQRDAARVLEGG